MDKNRNHTPRNYLRTLALITLVSFISTSILPAQSFATTGIAALFGEPASRDLSASTQLWKTRVPVEFGKVDETFFQTPGVPSRSTVIFIQDAHDSLEAQENITVVFH